MKQIIRVVLIFVLITLSACSNTPQTDSAPSAEIAPVSDPTSAPASSPTSAPVEEPAAPEGMVSDAFMTEGLSRINADPGAFGAFFAEYREQNHLGILAPEEFEIFQMGQLLDLALPANAQPAGADKVLIVYKQLGDDASITAQSGILLDLMAQLAEEQIPDSLLSYDKLIEITANPRLLSTTDKGLRLIQWAIEVSCRYIDTGDRVSGIIEGSQPEDLASVPEDAKYAAGSFPIAEAVNRALELVRGEAEMTLNSSGIIEGEILPQYGMFGEQMKDGIPSLSLPLRVDFAPAGTVSFAIRMADPDSMPIAGYEWVHWMAVNFENLDLPENASTEWAEQMIQGRNDFGTVGYGGPTPPDKPHTYLITVYALDAMLDLQNGFTKKAFDAALEGHILAEASITGVYPNTIDGFSN